jgi:hypothetical protein
VLPLGVADAPLIDIWNPPPQWPMIANAPHGYWKWQDFKQQTLTVDGDGTIFDPYEVTVTGYRSVVVAEEGLDSLVDDACAMFCVPGGMALKAGAGALVRTGARNALEDAARGPSFFRGARPGEVPSFTPRPNEFKVDPRTGFVKDTHGVSVFDNPQSVSSKGFVPHEVDQNTVPDSLRIIQRGQDLHHFEIVPRPGANLTPEQFISACNSILCVR